MQTYYWPRSDEIKGMTDSELVEYAHELHERRVAALDPVDHDCERAEVCKIARQLIKTELRARVMNRERRDADPELADLDEPLTDVVSPVRSYTVTVEF